jgi:hypothetical protein
MLVGNPFGSYGEELQPASGAMATAADAAAVV